MNDKKNADRDKVEEIIIGAGRVVFVRSHNSRKAILGTRDYRLYLTKLKRLGDLYSLLDEIDPEHVIIKHLPG